MAPSSSRSTPRFGMTTTAAVTHPASQRVLIASETSARPRPFCLVREVCTSAITANTKLDPSTVPSTEEMIATSAFALVPSGVGVGGTAGPAASAVGVQDGGGAGYSGGWLTREMVDRPGAGVRWTTVT